MESVPIHEAPSNERDKKMCKAAKPRAVTRRGRNATPALNFRQILGKGAITTYRGDALHDAFCQEPKAYALR
jgi:hypothetical protein